MIPGDKHDGSKDKGDGHALDGEFQTFLFWYAPHAQIGRAKGKYVQLAGRACSLFYVLGAGLGQLTEFMDAADLELTIRAL